MQNETARNSIIRVALTAGKGGSRKTEQWLSPPGLAALKGWNNHYRDTRQIYIEYRKSGYSKKFFEEHRQEITIHKAVKQAFDEAQITKLPSMQSLYEEFHRLTVQKKQDYAEYRKIRKEKEELLIAKQTVETILNIDKKKEKEQEKKSVR